METGFHSTFWFSSLSFPFWFPLHLQDSTLLPSSRCGSRQPQQSVPRPSGLGSSRMAARPGNFTRILGGRYLLYSGWLASPNVAILLRTGQPEDEGNPEQSEGLLMTSLEHLHAAVLKARATGYSILFQLLHESLNGLFSHLL